MSRAYYILIWVAVCLISANVLGQEEPDSAAIKLEQDRQALLEEIRKRQTICYSADNEQEGKLKQARSSIYNQVLLNKLKEICFPENYGDKSEYCNQFAKVFKEVLEQDSAMTFTFDSLDKINYVISADDNLRIFSWDDVHGGNWHDMNVLAQYRLPSGKVGVERLDTDEEHLKGGFTDVIIYDIYEIYGKERKYYLTVGWGTHGSGHHHSLAQIFTIEVEGLEKCEDCFDGGNELLVEAGRGYKIALTYHPETMTLTHNGFALNDTIGFYQPTDEVVTWELEEGKFVRVED